MREKVHKPFFFVYGLKTQTTTHPTTEINSTHYEKCKLIKICIQAMRTKLKSNSVS